jgi:hypothetical protein
MRIPFTGLLVGALLSLVAHNSVVLPAPLKDAQARTEDSEAKRIDVGKNVFVEVKDRKVLRVVVKSVVVLRDKEASLEGLLTIKGTKEHEYILGAEVDARSIHAGLLLCGAKSGSTVRFDGAKVIPPSGDTIKISLRYEKKGKTVTVPAQEWILDSKTKKPLALSWVFAGSRFAPSTNGKADRYMANSGDLICVCNMQLAMLDLPIRNPTAFEDRYFFGREEVIPPKGTPVEVLFELEKKAK